MYQLWEFGEWKNSDGERIKGKWIYTRSHDEFEIRLDSVDPITGRQRCLTLKGDSPEWGDWKLVR